MKTSKDRLHRVLVIGATPAGLAATNKLGEMGIPVTLVDSATDLNQKLSNEAWRLTSGLTLNYALRPGLLRILRNPRIRCVLPGKVKSLKHTPQGFSARLESLQTFTDPDRCTLCGHCVEACPVVDADGVKPIRFNGRQALPGRPVIEKRNQPLCQTNCPLGVNVQGYVALAGAGKYAQALDLIRRDNVLPGICGRVCTHPCEQACRRNELDEPLAIRDIKRFLADEELVRELSGPDLEEGSDSGGTGRHGHPMVAVPTRPERIAVIGSGPAGLAAAADLARLGYPVTVFEKEERPGGLLRYGIGPYRLPRHILDHDLAHIRSLGVEFRTAQAVDLPGDLHGLRERFAAVIVTTGLWNDRKLGVPGEDLQGVEGCISFLNRLYRGQVAALEGKIAVIGDGNAAFDLARTLARLGAKVTIVSWFPEDLVPADPAEIAAAREEGIEIIDRARVIGFIGAGGRLRSLRCAPTKPGEPDAKGIPWPVIIADAQPFERTFERAVVAIGQIAPRSAAGTEKQGLAAAGGLIQVNEQLTSGVPGVYAAGDAVNGASTVVQAMASGREAARAVHNQISGEQHSHRHLQRPADRDFAPITPDIPSLARVKMPERQPGARRDLFAEVALGLSEAQVHAEAERCLQCGACSECLQCVETCGSTMTIRHDQAAQEMVEQVGVVIIADRGAAPAVKGEDIIRAYSPKAAQGDVHAMMVRGFAAAAEAMTLLGGASQRMRGHGLSFAPPDPQLASELHLGIFVCRCKDSFRWPQDLNNYVAGLTQRSNIRHAEILESACTPEGSASILRTIREKGLTRVVLASCVCCPLDFICSACTDQRSRLKDALFSATGISRGMVETCNLRGEVLPLLEDDAALGVSRFVGLVERSIGRARLLKTLPAPVRPYNFTTAVLGDSEAAVRSAVTIADSGMEVLLFGAPDRRLAGAFEHPNIHHFDAATVKGLRGTIGNFQLVVEANGLQQVLQVGCVILGEKSRKHIPYMPTADLPPHMVESSMQKRGVPGIPFFNPGATSIPGLFLANPPGINVSERIKGAAAAILAASVMPRRPRQNKGYTVSVDQERCRGCGRCIQVCPYQAVSFRKNALGGWHALVDEALCKGCGNCIPVCPCNAADSPFRDRHYLEQMVEEILL